MFSLIVAALNTFLGFIFRTVVIKFIILFAIYFLVIALAPVLTSLLPIDFSINSLLVGLPNSAFYALNLTDFPSGFSLCLSAMATRFIIRRIPLIG